MNRKNEKGFTLVLSLVLLMAMSLMGGALIVISASDHQSNKVVMNINKHFMLLKQLYMKVKNIYSINF